MLIEATDTLGELENGGHRDGQRCESNGGGHLDTDKLFKGKEWHRPN